VTKPSIWDNSTGALVPAGTPQLKIRYEAGPPGEQPSWVVYADEQAVHREHVGYLAAHRWAQNKYHLTSTPMTVVCQDYMEDVERQHAEATASLPPPESPDPPRNKYRKEPET
jgi:hypothetical protein